MVFDPSSIKRRPLGDTPKEGSREERVHVLAKMLHERGLTASVADARRLAEGMVDTERKVISQSGGKIDDRRAFQSEDSPLFKAVGGVPRLNISDDLQAFVERAAPLRGTSRPLKATESAPRERDLPAQKPVFYDEAPKPGWKVPEKEGDPGYEKTLVESSDDGVVARHVTATATEDVIEERGVIVDDAPGETSRATPEEIPEEKPSPEKSSDEDLAKRHGIDLFDVFNANK